MIFGQDSRFKLEIYFKEGTAPYDFFKESYGIVRYYSRPNEDESKEIKSFKRFIMNQIKKYKTYIKHTIVFNNITNQILNPKTLIGENEYKNSYTRK